MKLYAAALIAVFVVCALGVGLRFYIRYLVEKQISRFQNDLLQRQCEEVENMYRQTRGWRHDFKNHLQTMQAYLEMGEIGRLGNYMRELAEDYSQVDSALKTGNAMLDAVLNSKISMLRAKEIRVDATAMVPERLPVSDVDLSVMIGNLLDNSLEACMKLPPQERFVRVYIAKAKDNLYLYVMNSAGGGYRRGEGGYLSTKGAEGHGYGLWRIDKVVRKYKGYCNRQDEGDVFATEILLPL